MFSIDQLFGFKYNENRKKFIKKSNLTAEASSPHEFVLPKQASRNCFMDPLVQPLEISDYS